MYKTRCLDKVIEVKNPLITSYVPVKTASNLYTLTLYHITRFMILAKKPCKTIVGEMLVTIIFSLFPQYFSTSQR